MVTWTAHGIGMKKGINMTTATLLKGWGYWDTTHYPYGGCFKRSTEDTQVEVRDGSCKPGETCVRFSDGRTAVADNRALKLEESKASAKERLFASLDEASVNRAHIAHAVEQVERYGIATSA